MDTSEIVVAGLLPDVSAALGVTVSHAGWLITVFRLGLMVGAR
jgi:predicted MFS family arabinose efflux permease